MALTERRKEFLYSIFELYKRTNKPVHYVEVAKDLGVSKWTAYDVMKNLANHDFLERQYITGSDRGRGRSQIVFKPTSKTEALFYSVKGKEWDAIKRDLLNRFRNKHYNKSIDEILGEIKEIKLPLFFSAYTLTLLVFHLVLKSQNSLGTIKNMILTSSNPELLLVFFVGSALGSVLENSKQHYSRQITLHVCKFNQHMKHISHGEKQLLADFLKEVLYHV